MYILSQIMLNFVFYLIDFCLVTLSEHLSNWFDQDDVCDACTISKKILEVVRVELTFFKTTTISLSTLWELCFLMSLDIILLTNVKILESSWGFE